MALPPISSLLLALMEAAEESAPKVRQQRANPRLRRKINQRPILGSQKKAASDRDWVLCDKVG